jgi:peptidylprolyl isomerase domain and WD repeat-containing protein 1
MGGRKRPLEEEEAPAAEAVAEKASEPAAGESDSDDDDFGPRPVAASEPEAADQEADAEPPAEAKPAKKKRVLAFEKTYVDALPCAVQYERSYMHRDLVTHSVFTPGGTDFLVTASADGHVKFWKKMPEGVEFVKHYHAHLGAVHDLQCSADGQRLCTTSADRTVKFYDVLGFDMIHMLTLDFTPTCAAWISDKGRRGRVAIADADSGAIRIYYSEGGEDQPVHTLSLHSTPVKCLAYNAPLGTAVSIDVKGVIEYWGAAEYGAPPKGATTFKYKVSITTLECCDMLSQQPFSLQ